MKMEGFVSAVSHGTSHKAKVYDVGLNAVFKARELDSQSLDVAKTHTGLSQ